MVEVEEFEVVSLPWRNGVLKRTPNEVRVKTRKVRVARGTRTDRVPSDTQRVYRGRPEPPTVSRKRQQDHVWVRVRPYRRDQNLPLWKESVRKTETRYPLDITKSAFYQRTRSGSPSPKKKREGGRCSPKVDMKVPLTVQNNLFPGPLRKTVGWVRTLRTSKVLECNWVWESI